MSAAVRVLQGKFGRVALLDMDRPLVTHGHSQCHVLIKVSGEDTFFTVRDKVYPLNDHTAVLINSWEPHASQPGCATYRHPGTVYRAIVAGRNRKGPDLERASRIFPAIVRGNFPSDPQAVDRAGHADALWRRTERTAA